LLLLLSFAAEALDNPVGQPSASQEESALPLFSLLLPEPEITAETASILDEARRQSGVGLAPVELRAMAAWPGFLGQYWRTWSRITESPLLDACENQLLLHALELAQRLPGPVELSFPTIRDCGLKEPLEEDDFSGMARLTRQWTRAFARQLLQISAAKIALEGGSGSARLAQEAKRATAEEAGKKETPTRAA